MQNLLRNIVSFVAEHGYHVLLARGSKRYELAVSGHPMAYWVRLVSSCAIIGDNKP